MYQARLYALSSSDGWAGQGRRRAVGKDRAGLGLRSLAPARHAPGPMLMLAAALAAGALLGVLRGGRLRNLSHGIALRAPHLVLAAVALQVALPAVPPQARGAVLAVSYVLVGSWLLRNLRHRSPVRRAAMGLLALGWMLNVAAIAPNGSMPVSEAALRRAGGPAPQDVADVGIRKHVPASPATTLSWLGDVIPFPPFRSVVSVGDLAMLAGIVIVVATGTARRPDEAALEAVGMNPVDRAAQLIERHGWCRGRFRDEEGRMCLDFALVLADIDNNEAARTCVLEELRARGHQSDSVVAWNDDPARSEGEVLDVLRRAARRWPATAATRPAPVYQRAG